eukprot:44120_1
MTALLLLSISLLTITGSNTVPKQTIDVNNAILNKLNEYRSTTALGNTPNQPPATNMNKLVWDQTLSDAAKLYISKCQNYDKGKSIDKFKQLDPYKNKTFKWNYYSLLDIGESTSWIEVSDANITIETIQNIITTWYMQYEHYIFQNDTCNGSNYCDYYTGMTFAETRYVGCAYKFCNSFDAAYAENSLVNVIVMSCNYYPSSETEYGWKKIYCDSHYIEANDSTEICYDCPSDRGDSCTDGLCDGCIGNDYIYCTTDTTCGSNCTEDLIKFNVTCNSKTSIEEGTQYYYKDYCRDTCDICGDNVIGAVSCGNGIYPTHMPTKAPIDSADDSVEKVILHIVLYILMLCIY